MNNINKITGTLPPIRTLHDTLLSNEQMITELTNTIINRSNSALYTEQEKSHVINCIRSFSLEELIYYDSLGDLALVAIRHGIIAADSRFAYELAKAAIILKNEDRTEELLNPFLAKEGELLWLACQTNQFYIAEVLFEDGAEIDPKNEQGAPLLMYACQNRMIDWVDWLIEKGANIHAKDKNGITIFHSALMVANNDEVVNRLIQKGAKLFLDDILNLPVAEKMTLFEKIYTNGYWTLVHDILLMAEYSAIHLKGLESILYKSIAYDDVENIKILIDLIPHDTLTTIFLPVLYNVREKNYKNSFEVIWPIYSDVGKLSMVDALINRKYVALILNLNTSTKVIDVETGKNFGKISQIGGFSEAVNARIVRALSKFFNCYELFEDTMRKQILDAYQFSMEGRKASDCFEMLQTQKILLMNVGWTQHAVSIVFLSYQQKTYLAICNCGQGVPSREETIDVFVVDKTKMTKELFAEILHKKWSWSAKDGANFYYELLPSMLSPCNSGEPVRDEICELFKQISPRLQVAGNCCVASPRAATRFILTMSMLKNTILDTSFGKFALNICKLFQDFLKFSVVQDYFANKSPFLAADEMLEEEYKTEVAYLVSKERGNAVWSQHFKGRWPIKDSYSVV